MGKIWVEVCLISGRGLRRTSSLWKLQWYAVGWIHPKDKYCTRIDTSGKANPVWKTRFSTAVDPSEPELQDLAVHVEVFSREPIFLRESLLGSATILLKEFLDKYHSHSDVPNPKPVEEVGSFQLRKRNSNKPLGFVDVSIRISQEREEPASSSLGADEGFNLNDHGSLQPSKHPETSYQMPIPPNYSNYYPTVGGATVPSYQPPRTPPPPPPQSNVGYIPNLFPNYAPSSYINMPSAVAPPARGVGPGFGMGLGAGALAAGAVIFGDDFMPGFDVPAADSRDASVSLATYPPF